MFGTMSYWRDEGCVSVMRTFNAMFVVKTISVIVHQLYPARFLSPLRDVLIQEMLGPRKNYSGYGFY